LAIVVAGMIDTPVVTCDQALLVEPGSVASRLQVIAQMPSQRDMLVVPVAEEYPVRDERLLCRKLVLAVSTRVNT
jgi:hypothetical protein